MNAKKYLKFLSIKKKDYISVIMDMKSYILVGFECGLGIGV
jgi:hypothetical protein